MIKVSINLDKINKDWFFQGKHGKMLDLTIIPKKTEFSDYMIVQDIPKAIRAENPDMRGPIVGNGKEFVKRGDDSFVRKPAAPKDEISDFDDIPF